MNREESIALANELCTEYRTIKGLQRQIGDNETLLRELSQAKPAHRKLISFFWRYLMVAGIVFIVMLIPSVILSMMIFFIAFESNLKPIIPQTAIAIVWLINFAVPALIIILGIRKAKQKRRDLNLQDAEKAEYNKKRMDELMRQTDEIRMQVKAKQDSLQKYNDIIPESIRDSEKIETVRRLLVGGKAETITEAVEMVK